MRCSGMPLPRWMCGAVTSMPSLTRSGRPSFSFRSSSPLGSTSTALRVRSATLMRASLLRDGVETFDLDRLELVRRLETRDPTQERKVCLARALDVLGLAKTVALARKGDVGVRDAAPLQRVDDHLGLGRRDDFVVEPLQQEQ